MKPLLYSFRMFIQQITKDSMLFVVCTAPLLTAFFFYYGIPQIEGQLCGYFNVSSILAGYYLLFDLFLGILTPFLFCFASSMVVLTEYDDNIASYLAVTPVGKKGYVVSRFLFPAAISFLVSMILMTFFTLTAWSFSMMLISCVLFSIQSIVTSLIIVSFSNNRVEGMAVSKLSGIMMLGLMIPFFLSSWIQYLFWFLPSLWIAKLSLEENLLFMFPALATSLVWIWLLYRKFRKKPA